MADRQWVIQGGGAIHEEGEEEYVLQGLGAISEDQAVVGAGITNLVSDGGLAGQGSLIVGPGGLVG